MIKKIVDKAANLVISIAGTAIGYSFYDATSSIIRYYIEKGRKEVQDGPPNWNSEPCQRCGS